VHVVESLSAMGLAQSEIARENRCIWSLIDFLCPRICDMGRRNIVALELGLRIGLASYHD